MTEINAVPAGCMENKVMTVKMSKITEGIGMVFSGVLTMLEGIDTKSAQTFLERFVQEEKDPGKTDTLKAANVKGDHKNASAEYDDASDEGTEDGETPVNADLGNPAGMGHNQGVGVTETGAGDSTDNRESEVVAKTENLTPAPVVSQDDITRVIVRKIKQDRSNSEKIASILKTYGVAKVSGLPAEKYEAFLMDISQI